MCRSECTTGLPDVRKHDRALCMQCWRLRQAKNMAQSSNKAIPTWDEMQAAVPADMLCPCCGVEMTLHRDISGLARVMSLQHWQDGSIGWVCFSCNSRMQKGNEDAWVEFNRGVV
jgi:hypothetical protein